MKEDQEADYSTDTAKLAALRARDKAADGVFVYAVRTTGVFCKPSCPARPALERNIVFFAEIASAEAAGFRACKRCKPRGTTGA